MSLSMPELFARALKIVIALIPWGITLYIQHWLEREAVWEVSMPYRSLISVVLLVVGMGLSFVLYNWLTRKP